MAEVFILVDASGGEQTWKENVKAVVLPSHKVITKDRTTKLFLMSHIYEAQSFWEQEGNTGKVPAEKLYNFLTAMNCTPVRLGGTASSEDAREYMKLSGGL